jgi:hypothetical protein
MGGVFMVTEVGMKKRPILIALAALTLLMGGCGTPGGAVSGAAEVPVQAAEVPVQAAEVPVQAAEVPVQAAEAPVQAAEAPSVPSPYYTGEGGKGLSIAILAPQGKGLAANQDYLPALVQGEFVSNFSGYSAISVLDRESLDEQYSELLSGYYEEDAEAGMDLGHLPPTDCIMGGSITKTTTGYALQIQITQTADKMTAASYSGTCTFAELDSLSGVRQASLDLLQKMGVELTERSKTELARAAAANHVNAQTALAQGITAQKSGTVVEALSYYYQAESFDPALLEAANRVGTMSAEISSGNIGENVRSDIQRRKEWQKLLTEAEDYFSKHLPWEIVYNPTLTQGKVDYARETVDLSFSLAIRPTDGFKTINTILTGLEATGKQEEWGMNLWPLSSSVFVDEIITGSGTFIHSGGVLGAGEMHNRNPFKKISVIVQLVNTTTGKVIATGDEHLFRLQLSFRNFRWVDTPGGPIGFGDYKWDKYVLASGIQENMIFPNVNANNITDNMTVKIVSVNGIDAETIEKTGYIRISTGGMR